MRKSFIRVRLFLSGSVAGLLSHRPILVTNIRIYNKRNVTYFVELCHQRWGLGALTGQVKSLAGSLRITASGKKTGFQCRSTKVTVGGLGTVQNLRTSMGNFSRSGCESRRTSKGARRMEQEGRGRAGQGPAGLNNKCGSQGVNNRERQCLGRITLPTMVLSAFFGAKGVGSRVGGEKGDLGPFWCLKCSSAEILKKCLNVENGYGQRNEREGASFYK